MAYILGEAAVRVIPNAENFHKDLRREVRQLNKTEDQVKIQVKLDENDTSKQLDRIKFRVDDLDGKVINLKVDLDDSDVSRKMADLHQRADQNPIEQRVTTSQRDIQEVNRIFDDFRKSQVDKPMNVHVLADWAHADQEMDDFREKQKAKPIVQVIKVDAPTMPHMPGAANMDRETLSMARTADQAIRRQWSIISLVPDIISKMNEQVNLGIRQIYDPYLRNVASVYNALAKPFRGFRQIWNESKTMNDFIQRLGDSTEGFRRKVGEAMLAGYVGLHRMDKAANGLIKQMRKLSTSLQAAGNWVGRIFSDDRALRKFGRTMADQLGTVQQAVGRTFSNIGKTVSRGMRPVTNALRSVTVETLPFLRAGHAIRHVFELFKDRSLGKAIANLLPLDVLVSFNILRDNIQEVAGGLRSMAGGWSRAFVGTIQEIGDKFAEIGMKAQQAAKTVGSAFAGVGRAIGQGIANNALVAGVTDDIVGLADIAKNAFTRRAKRWGPALAGVFDGLKTRASDLGREVSEKISTPLKNFGAVVGEQFAGMSARAKRHFPNVGYQFRRTMNEAFSATGGAFTRMGRGISSRAGKVFAPVGRAMSGVLSKSMNDKTTFRAMQMVMRRLSDYTMGFARIATGAFAQVGGVIVKSLLPALVAAGAGMLLLAGQAAIGAVLALGGAIMSVVSGALLMAPALAAAAGISFAVLKIGLADVGDAVSSAFSAETVEEFEESLEGLPASVQEIARAFREFKPAMDEMKRAVQDNLLEGLGPGITASMNALFPTISSGMQAIAAEWNGALKQGLDQLSSPEAESGMVNIMAGITEMSKEMQPVLANLIAAFGDLAEQGAKHLAPIGGWITDLTQDFRDWAASLREINQETGLSEFDTKIQNAATNLGHLAGIFGGLFGTVGNVFAAGAEGGQGMLGGMATAMQNLNESTKQGTENYEKMVGFMHDAGDAASMLGQVLSPIFAIIVDIGSILANVAEGSIPGIADALGGVDRALDPIRTIAYDFGKNLGDGIGALTPAIESLGGVLAPLLDGIGGGLNALLEGIGPGLNEIITAFQPAAEALAPNFVVVGEALVAIFEQAAPLIASGASILEAMAPILGDIFEWIGLIGAKLLEVIGPLLTEHDEQIVQLLENIRPLVDVIGGAFMKLLEFISPYIGLIADAFGVLVGALAAMIPYIIPIADFFLNVLVHGINIILPLAGIILGVVAAFKIFGVAMQVFNFFRKMIQAVTFVWKLLSLAFAASPIGFVITAIGLLIGALIYFFTQTDLGREIWGKFTAFLGDAWQWFADKMAEVWQWIVDNVWNRLVSMVDWIKDVWGRFTSGLGDAWSSFRDTMVNVWNDVKGKVFDTVQGIVDGFVGAFQRGVEGVKNFWDGLKKIFSDPITFFIETVVNKGVVGGWNAVMGLIGKEDEWGLQPIGVPQGMRFAGGGVLPGYTPGKDIHTFYNPRVGNLHLSGGEAIMRPEWTQAVGGPKAVQKMNLDARHGRIHPPGLSEKERERLRSQHRHADGGVLAFAKGGVLEAMANIVGAKYPALVPIYSGYRPGGPYHGTHQAGDFSNGMDNTPAQNALAKDIALTYPGSAELIYETAGFDQQIKDGRYVGAGGGSYGFYAGAGNHRNHVHWAMTVPPTMPFGGGVFEGGSGGGGGISGLAQSIFGKIGEFFSPLTDKITDFVQGFGHYGNLAIGLTSNLVTNATQALKDKVTELLPGWMRGGGGEAGNTPWEPSAGAMQWKSGIIAAFARQGEQATDERVNALLRQIDTESKGNPNVAQQIVDSNGTGASAGLGLYQFIPTTFAAYRDPGLPNDRTNPDAAHNAAVRYFRDRHGWNTGPGGVGRGHGWKTGGVLPDFFDQGGIANGVGNLLKNTIRPERVLSPSQTVAFNDFVYRLMPEMITQIRSNPTDIKGHVDRLLAGFDQTQMKVAEFQAQRVDALAVRLEDSFTDRSTGNLKVPAWDSNYDRGWWDRNGDAVTKNFNSTLGDLRNVMDDPYGYREAEQRAKEALDEAEKIARDEAQKVADEERNARKQAELDATESEEEKQRIEDRYTAEAEAAREQQQRDQEEIDELKKSGEYYYGYKTFGDDASNPNEYEASEAEQRVMSYADALAAPLGLDTPWKKISEKIPEFQSLGSAIETAVPAWQAALSGDRAGYNHNVAVSQIAFREQRGKELEDLGPSALAGVLEMAMSTSAQRAQQPFIGELNYTGLSDAEFAQRMDYWEAKKARQGSGTIRTR